MDFEQGIFIESIKRTPTITSFRFKLKERVSFIPGQHMEVAFDKDNAELKHFLSFSSSPTKDYIEFTKRLSQSKFSDHLRVLKEGDNLYFKLPLGNCTLDDNYKKVAFLIGGIGITPVISMLDYIAERDLGMDSVLIYSNRTVDEIAFKEELDLLNQRNNTKVVYTVTDQDVDSSQYIKSRIDVDLVRDQILDIKERVVFVFGPPKMVDAMKALLLELGVSNDNIKTESFWGY